MAVVRDAVRRVVWKTGKIVTTKGEIPEGQGLEYRDYFDYSEPIAQIPPHRVLAINRGDKEGPLKVKLEVPRPELEAAFFRQLPLEGHPQAEVFRAAAIDALDRLLLPSMEREVRRDLTEMAERHAVDVFARNLRSLLLQPPIPKQVVLAIDPGFRTGCKVAVLDPHGNLLDQAVIYPHPPQNRRSEAKLVLKDLVGKHKVGVVAIGNGTACRETEELIAEIIAEGTQFSQGDADAQPGDAGDGRRGRAPSGSRAEPAAAEDPEAAAEPAPSRGRGRPDERPPTPDAGPIAEEQPRPGRSPLGQRSRDEPGPRDHGSSESPAPTLAAAARRDRPGRAGIGRRGSRGPAADLRRCARIRRRTETEPEPPPGPGTRAGHPSLDQSRSRAPSGRGPCVRGRRRRRGGNDPGRCPRGRARRRAAPAPLPRAR